MKCQRFLHVLLMLFFVGGISAQETRQLSAEAEALLKCFNEIYGEKIISGCTANVNWNINEAKWVYQHTGKWPAINFFDFIHLPFSPSNWIDYSNVTEVVNWNKNGGIVGFKYFGFGGLIGWSSNFRNILHSAVIERL